MNYLIKLFFMFCIFDTFFALIFIQRKSLPVSKRIINPFKPIIDTKTFQQYGIPATLASLNGGSEVNMSPSILNISSFAALLDQFSDVSTTLILPFRLALLSTNRFKIRYTEESNHFYFDYYVRESFCILLEEVRALVNQEKDKTIRYVGAEGAGKSHNLAALVVFLRECKLRNLGFSKDVVFIPTCQNSFYQSPIKLVVEALIYTFPDSMAHLKTMNTWSDIQSFIKNKPKCSILFIFDDWQFNADLSLVAYDHYKIEASAGIRNRNPPLIRSCYLHASLTDSEWAVRKARSRFISGLSREDEAKLWDYTGGVPLYLSAMESCEGRLRQRMAHFSRELGVNIVTNLENSSRDYAAVNERDFMRQMRNAVTGEADCSEDTLYNHRYFYRDSEFILRPVSGFVREAMREILRDFATKAYYRQLDKSWIDKAISIGNEAVKDFAFKTYAVYAVTCNPSRYFEGVPHDIAECTVKYFDGDYPSLTELGGDRGLTLFRPTQSSTLRYVNAVARYVPEQGSEAGVTIYSICATLQSFTAHKQAIKFFKDANDQACDALQYIHPDEASKARFVMTWIGFDWNESPRDEPDELPTLSPDRGLQCSSVARYVDMSRDLYWGNVQVITDEYSY